MNTVAGKIDKEAHTEVVHDHEEKEESQGLVEMGAVSEKPKGGPLGSFHDAGPGRWGLFK